MAPGLNTYNPNEKAEWQAAYKEGFAAGKRAALRELKYALKDIEKLEAFSTSSGTATTHPTSEISD